jgi:hypothetical protein
MWTSRGRLTLPSSGNLVAAPLRSDTLQRLAALTAHQKNMLCGCRPHVCKAAWPGMCCGLSDLVAVVLQAWCTALHRGVAACSSSLQQQLWFGCWLCGACVAP